MNIEFFHNMDYDLFLRCLTETRDGIDETEILFLDDRERGACMIGYLPYVYENSEEKIRYFDLPYWQGTGCDVEGGTAFLTAEELLHTPVYGGRSIAQAWEHVCVLTLGMMPLEYWFKTCPFKDDVIEENGIWKLRSHKQK